MLLYQTTSGIIVEHEENWHALANGSIDFWIRSENMYRALLEEIETKAEPAVAPSEDTILAPIESQEVWAAGVTYFRSRTARMEESSQAGGSDFYDRVYHADRPELFMKATPHRVVGHRQTMRLREDSRWIVPEPELTLLIGPSGDIIGYTVGNDLSCRDIEGENPLYLPQAKTFDACAAIGPAVFVTDKPLDRSTRIELAIWRSGQTVFEDSTDIGQMKKTLPALVSYLCREMSFPRGCYLMTGTGIVPPDDFTLIQDDEIYITIDSIGTLVNTVR